MREYGGDDWVGLQKILILLLFLCFCLYLPTIFHLAFADDDIYLAFTNRFLRESPWTELYQFFLKPANPWEFLPLRDFTYWLDFRVYGDDNGGFHATNLLWYAASVLAAGVLFHELILFCRTAWRGHARVLALCGAVLFAVHPAHIEVVAWIASRKDLIAGTLGLVSLALLTHALRESGAGRGLFLPALILFLGCFGKASAITLIFPVSVLLGIVLCDVRGADRRRYLGALLLFWLLIAVAFFIHLHFGAQTGIRLANHPGLWPMIERASRIFTALVGILLYPYPLHFYHDVYQIGDWHWLVSAAGAGLLFLSLWAFAKRRSLWAFGIILVFSPWVVHLQLMPYTTWSLASERFVFVSVAGLSLVLIDFMGRLDKPPWIGGFILLVFIPSALLVWSRIADWERNTSMQLAREYELQPGFHNAIRDHIILKLLPEKRHSEAEALARQLPRSYAAEAVLSLIDTDRAFQRWHASRKDPSGDPDGRLRQGFCDALVHLRVATRNGYAHIRHEPDVSYNNLIGSIDRKIKYTYGDSIWLCDGKDWR